MGERTGGDLRNDITQSNFWGRGVILSLGAATVSLGCLVLVLFISTSPREWPGKGERKLNHTILTIRM